MALSFRQLYSSVAEGLAEGSVTLKRKHPGEGFAPVSSASPSNNAKRQKLDTGCCKVIARNAGEDSLGSQWAHPLVRQPSREYGTRADKSSLQSYHPAVATHSITESGKSDSSQTWHGQSARCSSISTGEAILLNTPKKSQTPQKDTMDISNRKRHFIYTPGDGLKYLMKKFLHDVYGLFDDSRSKGECWLHPSPPAPRINGRPLGIIQRQFTWKDSSGKHRLSVNFGIVALIIEHHLTEEQMEGFVNESWHLSHLCGNWTCCNWRHMTVESGRINISRNQCFPVATHCSHDPTCMKDRKRQFPVTPVISSRIRTAIESIENCPNLSVGFQSPTTMAAGSNCGICGKGVLYGGEHRICCSLTSISKSRKLWRHSKCAPSQAL